MHHSTFFPLVISTLIVTLGPFSFDDIDRISTYCMNLTDFNLVFLDLTDEQQPPLQDLRMRIWPIPEVLSLPWVYARSNFNSPVENEIIRRTVMLMPQDLFETLCVSIDLAEFRRWKEKLMGQPRDVCRPVWPTPYKKKTADWRDFT